MSKSLSPLSQFERNNHALGFYERHQNQLAYEQLLALRNEKIALLDRECWQPLIAEFVELPDLQTIHGREWFESNLSEAFVTVGKAHHLTKQENIALGDIIKQLTPWRKGPFRLFDYEIDAEWRSDKKWDRIAPHLGSLKGKKVADIGCGNGYYMFRALSHTPDFVLGFDPFEQFYFSFHLVQRFLEDHRLGFELLGVEQMDLFHDLFDVVLCMGIIYHQKNPVDMLRSIHSAMAPGGMLILESQGIPGHEPLALFPLDRYAQMRNVYFVPTSSCLAAWVRRAGFVDIEVFSEVKLTDDEQRTTSLGSVLSLADYLDPEDRDRTIEGYPAPLRIALKAFKKE